MSYNHLKEREDRLREVEIDIIYYMKSQGFQTPDRYQPLQLYNKLDLNPINRFISDLKHLILFFLILTIGFGLLSYEFNEDELYILTLVFAFSIGVIIQFYRKTIKLKSIINDYKHEIANHYKIFYDIKIFNEEN